MIHEFIGHSLVAFILGAHVTYISALNMGFDHASDGVRRIVGASGCLSNILSACIALAILRKRPRSANLRYFLWIFLTLGLLIATGYPAFSAVEGSGDWINVIRDLPHLILWKVLLFLVSAILYGLALKISAQELVLLIGSKSRDVARQLVIPAYIAGGLVFSAAAAFNAKGPYLLIWAAAASYGSMAGIVACLVLFKSVERADLPIEASLSWILLAIFAIIVFVPILGPGIKF